MHILLVGCGHLGQALLRRWLAELPELHAAIVKPSSPPPDLESEPRLTWLTRPPQHVRHDAIVYAIRPQHMAQTLPEYRHLAADAVNISVAAGWTLAKLAQHLGPCALVRTMPNIPAQIGQGITPMTANDSCTPAQRRLAEVLFGCTGAYVWLEQEAQMDVATAVSGSGPAYVYLLTAAMTAAGTELGLPQEIAAELARATVRGAANYMIQAQTDAETLYRAMLLPGGTTEAAMRRLLASDGMIALMRDAMTAAARRAAALGAT